MRQMRSSWGMIAACGLLRALLPSCDRSADQAPDAVMFQRANLAKGTGLFSQPWFKSVYEIRHGWYYHYYSQEGPTGYDLCYDLDSQQFHVYWSHG